MIKLKKTFYNKDSIHSFEAFLKIKNNPEIRNKALQYATDTTCTCCFYFLEYFKDEILEINYMFVKTLLSETYVYITETISQKYPVKTIKIAGIEQNNNLFLYSNKVLNEIYSLLKNFIENDSSPRQFDAILFMKKYVSGDKNPMIEKLTSLIHFNNLEAAFIAIEFKKHYFVSNSYKYMIRIAKMLIESTLTHSIEAANFAIQTNLFDNEIANRTIKYLEDPEQDQFNLEIIEKYLKYPLYSFERKISLQIDIKNDLTTIENIIFSDIELTEMNNWLFLNNFKEIAELNNYCIFYLLLKMQILNRCDLNIYIFNNITNI